MFLLKLFAYIFVRSVRTPIFMWTSGRSTLFVKGGNVMMLA